MSRTQLKTAIYLRLLYVLQKTLTIFFFPIAQTELRLGGSRHDQCKQRVLRRREGRPAGHSEHEGWHLQTEGL